MRSGDGWAWLGDGRFDGFDGIVSYRQRSFWVDEKTRKFESAKQ